MSVTPDKCPCFSCEVSSDQRVTVGGILYKGRHWSMALGTPCLVPGYVVLWTNRHVEFLGDLTQEEAQELGALQARACKAVQAVTNVPRVHLLYAGELVRHVHFHIIPRANGMPETASAMLKPFFAGEWRIDDVLALPIATDLRPLLQDPLRPARYGMPDDTKIG